MNNEPLFTFGENDQYEVIEARCVECSCELMFIQAKSELSLPVCEACVPIVQRQIKETLENGIRTGTMIDLKPEYDQFYVDPDPDDDSDFYEEE